MKKFSFSKNSLKNLESCHPDLQKLFKEIIKIIDCSILEGQRTPERQEELFKAGKSKLKGGKSKHNHTPSLAVDVAPYPINFENTLHFFVFAGFVKSQAKILDIPIRWGGDWDGDGDYTDQTFNDLVHWELLKNSNE